MKAVKTILFILICIGMLWLMFVLLGKAFRGNNAPVAPQVPELVTYANTDAKSSMYVDGPVKLDQEHEAWKIIVDRSSVTIQYIKGYENNVVRQQTFPNNVNSYAAFLKALDKAQFDSPNSTKYPEDERGYCPARNRYIFDLQNGSDEVVHSWWTTCGSGNFTGSFSTVQQLFINQIPRKDLSELRRGTTLAL